MEMQQLLVYPCNVAARTRSAVPGNRLYDVRSQRRIFVTTAATRGDWRAEIEGGSGRSGAGADKAVATGRAERSNGTISSAITESPSSPEQHRPASTPSAAAAAAPPPSPWSQPSPSPSPPLSPAPSAAAAAPPPPPASDSAAAAAGPGPQEEATSLPTFDLAELLAEPKHQANAFTALAAISAILASLSIVEPQAVLHLAMPKAYISDLDVTFLRIIGVTMAASAAVEYSLKHAAESQLLRSATYQRLMAGGALKSFGYLVVVLAYTPAAVMNPLVWLACVGTAVTTGAINLSVISRTSGKGLAPPPLDVGVPQNRTSWGYTTCAAIYLLTVLACFAPETLFTGEPYSTITPLVKGICAPGFLLAAVISYVLKDAADRGRLGASTFKNLNLGLAALEYGYSIIFGSAILSDQVPIDVPAISNLGGSLLIATFALYTCATAKK